MEVTLRLAGVGIARSFLSAGIAVGDVGVGRDLGGVRLAGIAVGDVGDLGGAGDLGC